MSLVRIIGTPRSGTTNAAALMRMRGLDIGHESMGRHGVSSWMYAVDAAWYPWGHEGEPSAGECDWGVTIHLVRHPLECVSSLQLIHGRSLEWAQLFYDARGASHVEALQEFWLEWNALCEIVADIRIRTEDLPRIRGLDNARGHTQLNSLVGESGMRCMEMARRYGY